ncbi:MAG: NAD(P)/FAD-dependent oxidoreductase, partial [bacterium]|nr:NAD(P)/FAD-dependent oxidoreductase [bacterium]
MSDLTHLDEVRDRYAAERARRIREDSSYQYGYLDGVGDPWAEPIVRGALHDEVDVVVMGAGLAGLSTAVKLRMAGVDRIRLIDRGGDVGGTWYWNRYPAVQCDVESYIYLPFLEEMGYIPSQKYAYGTEIFEYLQSVARKYDLYRDACFQTEVVDFSWSDDTGRWTVFTNRGDEIATQFVVVAGGFIQQPKLPG